MNISLTPELEHFVNTQLHSGFYTNASEVIAEALLFMACNEELLQQIKLKHLRANLAEGEADIEAGRFVDVDKNSLKLLFAKLNSDLSSN